VWRRWLEVAKLAHLVDLEGGFVAGEWSEIGGDLGNGKWF